MLMRVAGSVVFLSILLCALAAGTSEDRRRSLNRFFDDVGDSYSLMAPALTKKGNIKKLMRVLPQQPRATLVECLRRHDLRQHGCEHEETPVSKRFIDVIRIVIYGGRNIPRRDLLAKRSNTLMITPSPSPHHNIAHRESKQARHASAPSPARNIVPSNSPSPGTKSSHSPRPAPSQDLDFDALLPEEESFTPFTSAPVKPQPKEGNTAGSLNQAPAHPDKNNEWVKMAITALASTAVTFLVLALFFAICVKPQKSKDDPQKMQKDDRPLLKLMSEFSASSSQRSLSFDSSSNKMMSSTFGRVSSIKHISIVSENPKSPRQAVTTSETGALAPQQGALKLPPGKPAPPPPGPPPPPKPRPPPPPKGGRPPPAPPPKIGTHARGNSASTDGYDSNGDSEAPKAKLKPFFWDKVLASPNHSMVWHEIKSGSFQFNEEMMESLFGYTTADKNKMDNKKDSPARDGQVQCIQIIDPKKAQNLSILLRALNLTTEEVCDALVEGNELPVELLQTLSKVAPTSEEELKLRLYTGDPPRLGP